MVALVLAAMTRPSVRQARAASRQFMVKTDAWHRSVPAAGIRIAATQPLVDFDLVAGGKIFGGKTTA